METLNDQQTNAIPEVEQNFKLSKTKAHTRLESGNRRLKQAIDILLDYIMELEERSRRDTKFSEDQYTQLHFTNILKGTDGNDSLF